MFMSEAEAMTIVGRNEKIGKTYPMYIERILLLLGVIFFIFTFSRVSGEFDNDLIGILISLTVYPFIILFTIEVIGRIIQRMHID